MIEVIADLCQNHNGDKKVLREMVFAAAEAGATYAKIQSMRADDLTRREPFDTGVVENGVTKVIKRPYDAEYGRLKPLDLTDEDHNRFIDWCREANIKPMTTVFSRSRIPFIATLPLDTVKVSSFDCASTPMLQELKATPIPRIIISTGVSFDEEIETAAQVLRGKRFALLHCVSIYPTPLDQANIARLRFLRSLCPQVGLSDHTNPDVHGHKVAIVALLHGAEIIERHFTLLPKDKTKDGPVSVNFHQLKGLVGYCRMSVPDLKAACETAVPKDEYELILGTERRSLSHVELLNRDYYRGRFASRLPDGEWVYNWERKPVID
jgi:sialic acid synthase SpsE